MKRALRLTGFSETAAVITVMAAVAAMTVTIELALPVWAYGAAPHVHGVATLEIAVDGSAVQVNLNSPLDNLLGFERAPRNEKERQAIRTMASKLHQAGSLFIFTPAAQCRLESTQLESPLLPSELLMAHDKSDRSKSNKPQVPSPAPSGLATSSNTHADDHAELGATWNFRCAMSQALQGVDVRLFDTFPGLRRLDAMIAGPKGQSGAKLSPASSRLKW
jgi:Protein of unknown function (DUF2796)